MSANENPFTNDEVRELRELLAYHKRLGYPESPLLQLDPGILKIVSCGIDFWGDGFRRDLL